MIQEDNAVKNFYEKSYEALGFNAQRKYPNEELSRFMGRNFFSMPFQERKNIKILETGCGSGANLWMVAREGFDAYGIDFSSEGISLAQKMVESYGVQANLTIQDMCNLNFPKDHFDAVVDILSSYTLNQKLGWDYLNSVKRILKTGGLFFSYFPCKMSDAFIRKGDAEYVDSDTLNGIKRKDSPFYGNDYFVRFLHPKEYEEMLSSLGFQIRYSEILNKTYSTRQENFSFVIIEAKKL